MAKKKPSKKQAKKPTTAAFPALPKAPPPKPVDATMLDEFAENAIERNFGYNSPFEKQRKKVDQLESQLTLERQKLEHLAGPLRLIEKALSKDLLSRIESSQPWDAELKKELGRVQLKESKYGYGPKTNPTGAKSWGELKRDGATDEQIGKNLASIPRRNSGTPEFAIEGSDFVHMGPGERYWDRPKTNLIKGKKALVAEARRVFAIPQPTKASPAGKKLPAKLTKKIATIKKKHSASKSLRSTAKKPASKSNKLVVTKTSSKPPARSKAKKKKPAIEQPEVSKAEIESRCLDSTYAALVESGPANWQTVTEHLGGPMTLAVTTCLDRLVGLGRATKAGKIFTAVEAAAVAPVGVEAEGDSETAERNAEVVFTALEKIGPATETMLENHLGWFYVQPELGNLVMAGRAKQDGKSFSAIAATKTKAAKGGTKPAAGETMPAKSGTSDPLAALKHGNAKNTRLIAEEIGKSVDATGAQLRRLLKAGKVVQDGQLWKLPGVDSANGSAAAHTADDDASVPYVSSNVGTNGVGHDKRNRAFPRVKKPLFEKAK